MTAKSKEFIHEGDYVAEIEVDLIDSDSAWAPYLSVEDACKLDDVHDALREGDIKKASKLAKVYTIALRRVHPH
ncbi:MAG: hypothetical protein HYZ00_09600 [Candidatus Hydrogenedentes bacterium]|nr:hypothetical protein [Candidatus Hydrogenedentota bacterium]